MSDARASTSRATVTVSSLCEAVTAAQSLDGQLTDICALIDAHLQRAALTPFSTIAYVSIELARDCVKRLREIMSELAQAQVQVFPSASRRSRGEKPNGW